MRVKYITFLLSTRAPVHYAFNIKKIILFHCMAECISATRLDVIKLYLFIISANLPGVSSISSCSTIGHLNSNSCSTATSEKYCNYHEILFYTKIGQR